MFSLFLEYIIQIILQFNGIIAANYFPLHELLKNYYICIKLHETIIQCYIYIDIYIDIDIDIDIDRYSVL